MQILDKNSYNAETRQNGLSDFRWTIYMDKQCVLCVHP